MIAIAASAFFASIVLFVSLSTLFELERTQQKRLVLASFRTKLDRTLVSAGNTITKTADHFVTFVLKLNWHYSLHSLLRSILVFLGKIYGFFEHHFEQNRSQAKALRAAKRKQSNHNHLSQMAAHKVETALTPTQKRRLRHRKLEGKS